MIEGISFLIVAKNENGSYVPVSSPVNILQEDVYICVSTALRAKGYEIVLLPNSLKK